MEAIPAGTDLLAVVDKLDEDERRILSAIFEALARDIFEHDPAKFESVTAVKSDLLSLIKKGALRLCTDSNCVWVELT